MTPYLANSVMNAGELLDRLRSGSFSAREAVQSAIERCQAGSASNALISLRAGPALIEANAADKRWATGQRIGRLHGLPIVVKDNVAVGDWQFTGGSPAFQHHIAGADAGVVAALRAEGAIVVGKSSLHELAFGTTNNNAHYGAVRNPHDPSRIAGGSSGGSAAAVAAGFVPVAISSDTGGSGRIPAALCGCVGFRPTTGRYDADGVMLLSPTRDTVTTMAHCVGDIVTLDQVITGQRYSTAPLDRPLRLGVITPFADTDLDAHVRSAFNQGIASVARQGVELVPVDGSELLELDREIGLAIVIAESSRIWQEFAPAVLGIPFNAFVKRIASPDVRRIFTGFGDPDHDVPEDTYRLFTEHRLPRLRAAYAELFSRSCVDAFVFPTVPVSAPEIGEDETLHIDGQAMPLFPTMIRNVGPGSLAGVPGITLPLPVCKGQLPVGLALDAPAGADVALLGVAATIHKMLRNAD